MQLDNVQLLMPSPAIKDRLLSSVCLFKAIGMRHKLAAVCWGHSWRRL